MHNNFIEDRPETYDVIELTPLKVYCPQLVGSVHPPRLKEPWEVGTEPFGTYHPIHICQQHEPTAVLQKEADIPIRPANNKTEAQELNKALRAAMLQQQRLTTDQVTREMTRYTTDTEEDLLRMEEANYQADGRLSFCIEWCGEAALAGRVAGGTIISSPQSLHASKATKAQE
jgi:hypothetical protein